MSTNNEGIEDWSDQDLAVLGLLFGPLWQAAKDCEASSRPHSLKVANIAKLFHKSWNKTGVKLKTGRYVGLKARRHRFSGKALLLIVNKYRSNTKGRTQFKKRVDQALRQHYVSLPEAYQPADASTPLHEHWESVKVAVRPPPPARTTLMRESKVKKALQQNQQQANQNEVEVTVEHQMQAAVNVITK